MKVEMTGDKYLVTLTRDEILVMVNGLGEKHIMAREINSIINPVGGKKKDKQLDKIREELAEALLTAGPKEG